MLSLKIHSEAASELQSSKLYLRICTSEKVAENLIKDVKRTFTLLKQNPYIGEIEFGSVRSWNLQKYPYTLFYEIEPTYVLVLAIAHQSRQPL